MPGAGRRVQVLGAAAAVLLLSGTTVAVLGVDDEGDRVEIAASGGGVDDTPTTTTTAAPEGETTPADDAGASTTTTTVASSAPRRATTTTAVTAPTTTTTAPTPSPCPAVGFAGAPALAAHEAVVAHETAAYALDTRTASLRRLFRGAGWVFGLSPDGRTYYAVVVGDCGGGAWAVPVDGPPRRVLTQAQVDKDAGAATPRLAVSRDGTRAVANGHVYEVGTGRLLASGGPLDRCHPHWMLDDRRLFCRGADNQSGQAQPLHVYDTHDGFRDDPIQPPAGCTYEAATVSRTGQRAAVRVCGGNRSSSTLVLVEPDGREGAVLGTVEGISVSYLALDATGTTAVLTGLGAGASDSTVVFEADAEPRRHSGRWSSAVW